MEANSEIWIQSLLFVNLWTMQVRVEVSQSFKMFPLQQYMGSGFSYNGNCLFYPETINLGCIG